jgi:hypothetical protein
VFDAIIVAGTFSEIVKKWCGDYVGLGDERRPSRVPIAVAVYD